jgi:hypothetical protein
LQPGELQERLHGLESVARCPQQLFGLVTTACGDGGRRLRE